MPSKKSRTLHIRWHGTKCGEVGEGKCCDEWSPDGLFCVKYGVELEIDEDQYETTRCAQCLKENA